MNYSKAKGLGEFSRAGASRMGYNRAEVDAYFVRLADEFSTLRRGEALEGVLTSTDIRRHCFAPEKNGYVLTEVDQAMDRIEDRFAQFERRNFLAAVGRKQWEQDIEYSAALVMGRLNRADGERFRRPSNRLTKGYFVKDVDRLCVQLKEHFRMETDLSPELIRQSVFASAHGDMCYEETQVDAFLDRCIELMLDLR